MNATTQLNPLVIRLEIRSTDKRRPTVRLIDEIQALSSELSKRLKVEAVEIQREQAFPIDAHTQVILIRIANYVGPILIYELTKRAVNILLDIVQDAIINPLQDQPEAEPAPPQNKSPEQ